MFEGPRTIERKEINGESAEIETLVFWCSKVELFNKVTELAVQGWMIVYTIVEPPQDYNIPRYVQNLDGTQTLQYPPMTQQTYYESQIEVAAIKINTKNPCPRCSYPFEDPNRLDREA